jgi:glycerol uptake facilitator-like aquaporin
MLLHEFEFASNKQQARNHFVATLAEFAGTVLFLFFAFSGTQVALLSQAPDIQNVVGTVSDPSQLMFIALSFGFSLAVNAWVFFRISGGLFNPAVSKAGAMATKETSTNYHRSLWECVLLGHCHGFVAFSS